ncbi:hypothetical protein AcW1_006296 [Taiwanofungus camphoratus]|nr:hypothetical protein AcW1_006296 [Antrodia cinnamomea]
MPKAKGPAFYAVARGRAPGVYTAWDECEAQVLGFNGAKHKKFTNAAEAEDYVRLHRAPSTLSGGSASQSAPPIPVSSVSRAPAPKPLSKVESKSSSASTAGSKGGKYNIAAEVLEDESGWDVVYSDGACKGNGQPGSVAGIGVWWGRDDPRNLAERCPGAQTNNRAELIAIVRVLETASRIKHPLLIKTDSQYSINCFRSWLPKWIATGFKSASGQPVKNAALIRYLSALLDERGRQGQKVHLQYVRGHVGEEGNEGADRLANMGALRPEAPERDWEALERHVCGRVRAGMGSADPKTMPSVSASAPVDDLDLEAYADCLLSPEELEMEMTDDDF